jgi:peptidoglycan/xylan/chitin deacetylase (PgdA/CDA1 family)
VAVTLDDGYVDGLTTAAPILEDTGVPATFFVTSDLLDRGHEYWWDVLEELLSSTAGLPSEFEMGPAGRIVPCQTDADRARLHQELIGRMYAANLDERSALLDRVVAWSGRRPCPRDTHRRLTGREIQALSGRPLVSIGAHSVHHLSLAHQAAPVQWHEVQECKRQLEALLGRPVEHFAYPYGDFTSDTMHVVRDAGFRSAVTVGRRTVRTGAVPFLVPRCEVPVRIGQEFGAWLTAQFEN